MNCEKQDICFFFISVKRGNRTFLFISLNILTSQLAYIFAVYYLKRYLNVMDHFAFSETVFIECNDFHLILTHFY